MKARTILALALACGALGSCGGDGGDSENESRTGSASTETTERAAPTRAEFIRQGDAVCERYNRKAKALNIRANATVRRSGDKGDQAVLRALRPIFKEGLKVQRDGTAAFEQLTPPAGGADQFRKIVDDRREQDALVRRLSAAADRGDAKAYAAIVKDQDRVRNRARKRLRDYGFKECGSGKNEAE